MYKRQNGNLGKLVFVVFLLGTQSRFCLTPVFHHPSQPKIENDKNIGFQFVILTGLVASWEGPFLFTSRTYVNTIIKPRHLHILKNIYVIFVFYFEWTTVKSWGSWFGANIIMFIEVSLALGRQLDPACLSKVRAKAFLVQTLAGKPRAGKQFGWEATEHLGWEATYVLGSTLVGKPSCWEATCWEAPIWLGSHFVGAVVWAGKPPCLGRLRVGGGCSSGKALAH